MQSQAYASNVFSLFSARPQRSVTDVLANLINKTQALAAAEEAKDVQALTMHTDNLQQALSPRLSLVSNLSQHTLFKPTTTTPRTVILQTVPKLSQ